MTKEVNKGVKVFKPDLKDISEIYAIRAALEGVAAAFVAAMDPEEESKRYLLFLMIEEMAKAESAYKAEDADQMATSNIAFHDLIIRFVDNENLQKTLTSLRMRTLLLRYSSLKVPVNAKVSLREHRNIFKMIKTGNIIAVEAYMRRNVLVSGYRILQSQGRKQLKNNLFNYFKQHAGEDFS